MKFAPVNGTQLRYSREGAGIPLICLHGGMGIDSQTLRGGAIEGLSHQGFDVAIMDQRGHSSSSSCQGQALSHDVWKGDVIGLADYLGWEQFALLGHSYGGFIALEAAVAWPERVSHLVLIATSAGPVSVSFPRMDSDAALETFFRERWPLFFHGQDKHWAVFDRLEFWSSAFNQAFQRELSQYDVNDQLYRIDAPALLIVGASDGYVDAMKRLSRNLSAATLEVLDQAGHFPFLEQPEAFARIVKAFFSG